MEYSRVELFAAIRRDARIEGLSIRALADRYRVHRRTVRQALDSPAPPVRKIPVTDSYDLALDWFSTFEGAGLDGVVAKPALLPYSPDARVMLK
ncbi:MAG: hypothetical protein ACR2JO_00085, partial [Mycobacteriales bacterium]